MSSVTGPAGKQYRSVIVDTVFLLLAFTALGIAAAGSTLVMDEDTWWHMRTGHWILAHGAVPVRESFSAHAMGQPWVAYSWLFEIMLAKSFDAWGYRAVLAYTTCVTFAFTACLTLFLTRFTNIRRAVILTFAACLALAPLKSPRSWLLTILFFTIELFVLWIARERNRPALLLSIIPLFVLWANVHIQFVYGLGLLGLFAMEGLIPAAARKALSAEPPPALKSKWLWMLLAASMMATLLNPYGWNLYRVVWEYASQPAPWTYIQEFQAIPFRTPSDWMFLLLVCSAIFVLGCAREKNLLLISLMAVSCWLGFRSQRDLWFPVAVAVLALAAWLRDSNPDFVRSRCIYGIAIPLSLVLTLVAINAESRFSQESMQRAVEARFPVKACDYIESHNLPGPLFNPLGWGGYLIWRLPQLPVSMDGRTNLYGDFVATAANTVYSARGWSDDPDLKKARTIILERGTPLVSVLRVDPQFHLIYEDKTAVIFQPQR